MRPYATRSVWDRCDKSVIIRSRVGLVNNLVEDDRLVTHATLVLRIQVQAMATAVNVIMADTALERSPAK